MAQYIGSWQTSIVLLPFNAGRQHGTVA